MIGEFERENNMEGCLVDIIKYWLCKNWNNKKCENLKI